MSNQQEPENLPFDNEHSLQTLVRTITFSQGEFSLILLRCNYTALRQRMVERLHQLSPIHISEIILPASVKTLYTNIREQIGDEQPPALMVFGLELVKDVETVLASANQVREEFKKNFPFPILLWVNDSVLQKFIRLATDLENWATIIEFENPTDDLVNLLQQKTDEIFADEVAPNPQMCWELETARKDLQNRGEVLEPALQASLKFVLGLNNYLHDQIDSALADYQESLRFWQQNNYLERQGILFVNIALVYNRQAEKNQTENQRYWHESKNYLQQAIEIFELAQRSDLVAKHITKLGEVLRHLQAWTELQSLVEKSLPLHQNYGTSLQLAKDYGFLAEVALEQSRWDEANQLAGQTLQILADIPNIKSDEFGLYRFILAKSQQALGQVKAAITNLETAKKESNHHYNPYLYISILERLRSLYFGEGEYLKAFYIKQEQLQIEQQYGFRAFVGASYLNPQRQAIHSAQSQVENPETIAQEIAASGRGQDVKRLRERIGGTEHKLTVIHGQSGVGKSSILQGGLIPALQQEAIGERDALPILLRVYTDWVGMLGQCLSKAFEEVRGKELFANLDSSAAILEQLRRNADRNLLTVLMFDQFEEFFFVYSDQGQRRTFYDFLRVCLDIPFVKVILSLREDYLHYLLELERLFNLTAINNNILDKNIRYYLGNFSPADAKAVVQSLTERSQFYLEPALIDELVRDLAGDLGEVRPIELQIVGTQLQTEKIISLDSYRQFGTKEKLVERFLEEVIHDCGAENEQVARLVLYLLTDENGTRPLKTRAELAADLVAEADKLDLVLEIFVASRLVLLLPESPADRYQLVHDYLVSFIRQQQGNEILAELAREREQRLQAEEKIKTVREEIKTVEVKLQQVQTTLEQAEAKLAQAQKATEEAEAAREEAQKGTELERAGVNALKQFEYTELESLVAVVRSGKELKTLVKHGRPLEKYPAVSPIFALDTILNKIKERNQFQGHQGIVWGVSFSPDGKTIATASSDKTARLWTLNGQLLQEFKGHQGRVYSVSFSPDGKTIATASSDKTARLWTLNGQLLQEFKGHQGRVYSVSFSLDGKTIATASSDKTARLWTLNGQLLQEFKGHQGIVWSVSFSPDGKTIATASDDKTARLWTLNGQLLQEFKGHQGEINSVSFSPDGKTIATASSDKTAQLWTLNGQLLQEFKGHQGEINSVSFSPDGKTIATASQDGTARLWTLNGQLLQEFKGHQGIVYSVSFSSDGKTIATASQDGTARLWTLNGQLLQEFKGHQGIVWGVSFSPDGKTIATASQDGTARLWPVDNLDRLLVRGCNWLHDYLQNNPNLSESDKRLCDDIK
ncbi:PD40 domain-containing protein [Nostoc sp. FACHB-892]|uniref:nSTAND1 domain-containing NTPase n=1 Tax=Nostoc sp. FACHB-892 TaxID=2692843 RepID=UPI0016878065|nr:PD40 domain-containing protein [Nostoc sp. FACHB-892]MBD2726137.1 PD40 domain-containing protein [Nostoc sp. FACHB-892]